MLYIIEHIQYHLQHWHRHSNIELYHIVYNVSYRKQLL